MGGDELIDQHLGICQGLAVGPVLQAAEGRGRGEGQLGVGERPAASWRSGIGAEGLVIVEVFVAEGDGDDPLGDHGPLGVDDEDGMSGVGDGGVDGVEEAEAVVDLAEEQGAGVGGEPPPVKSATTALGPRLEKGRGLRLQSVIAVAWLFGARGVY